MLNAVLSAVIVTSGVFVQPITSANATTTGVVVGSSSTKSSMWFRQWQEFRRNFDEQSDGSVLLDYLIFGELGSSEKMLSAVSSGKASMGSFNCKTLTPMMPELAVPQMPYLFASEDEADFVFDKSLMPIFSNILASHNLILLQWTEVGWSDLYSKTPVQFPSQLAGKQIRAVDNKVSAAFLRAIHADPVIISANEDLSPAQTEKIFGGFSNSVYYSTRAKSIFPYFTETHHSFDCGMFVANKTWFESLSPESQKIIRSSFLDPAVARKNQRDENRKIHDQLMQSTNVITLTAEQHNAWEAAGLPLYQSILQQAGGQSIQVYDAIREGKKAFLRQNAQPASRSK